MNNKIKWLVHERYSVLVSIILFILVIFAPILYIYNVKWEILIAVVGTLLSFIYFIQKQQLDEAKFSNELFVRFNQKYDDLNEKLNKIKTKKDSEMLEAGDTDALNDYFNLCGEEYLFYKRGYVYPEVWKSWVAGMKIFYEHPRIQKMWLDELNNHSYYGLDVDKEIKRLDQQKIALK